ncbi:hypothetical protein GOBAR_DD23560 [Gossypium barbadense]|nr:hypothetical protein GOBAR_DD23560 [Gossypium barbadense]
MGDKKKLKEDEKIEKSIRALLKLPENKRCINCNLLGPQYVCTTFSTFVCTTCSGIHREFTHRVKSVSMAKFTEEEENALREGGNERARQIYFKAWDPQRNSYPDASDLHMLRKFIKHVYVDRRYTGERSERLPSLEVGYRTESPEIKRVIVFTGRTKSPLYGNRHEWSSNEGFSPAGKSGAVRGFYNESINSRYEGSPRNHRHIEIIDHRRHRDGPGSAIQKDNPNIRQREPVTRSMSSSNLSDRSAPPVVRPIRDILGENAPALKVGEHSKENTGKDTVAKNQKISPPSGIESLIDFSMDSEPSNAAATPNMQQVPPSSKGGNQSSDELSSKGKAPPASNANPLDFLLFDLAAPSAVPVDNVSAVLGTSGAPSTASGQNTSLNSISPAAPEGQLFTLTSSSSSSPVPPTVNVPQVQSPHGHVFPSMQKHQSSLFPASDNSFFTEQSNQTTEASNSQPGTTLLMHNAQPSSSTEQSSEATSKSTEETKSGGRKELPQDLFATKYGSAPAAVPGWQTGLPHGAAFGLQYYPNAMHSAAFSSISKANPFDLSGDTTPAQAPQFPQMTSILGTLPSIQDPTALSPKPSTDAPSHSSHFASMMTPESPSTLAMPSSAYMGNQSHSGVPSPRPQGIGGFGSDERNLGFLNATQRPAGGQPASNPPNTFPTMGPNPFG